MLYSRALLKSAKNGWRKTRTKVSPFRATLTPITETGRRGSIPSPQNHQQFRGPGQGRKHGVQKGFPIKNNEVLHEEHEHCCPVGMLLYLIGHGKIREILKMKAKTISFGKKFYLGNYETESYFVEIELPDISGSDGINSAEVQAAFKAARKEVHRAFQFGEQGMREKVNQSSQDSAGEDFSLSGKPNISIDSRAFKSAKNALDAGKISLEYLEQNFSFGEDVRNELLK